MRPHKIRLYHILIIICFISIASYICIFAYYGGNGQARAALPIRIVGTYSIDGQAPEELTADTTIDNRALHNVTIFGHFSEDIPEGWVLMLRLDNIRATIRVNDTEVYSFGREGSTPAFSKTAGNTWGFYISPGITKADQVEINLRNVYAGTVTNMFDEFLKGLSYGHGFEPYQQCCVIKCRP